MTGTTSRLRSLAGTEGHATIVEPPVRWRTRVLVPAIILLAVAGLLVVTSAQVLLPATRVRVAPVMVKTVAGSSGSVTVQAPGWLEPDPHPQYVAALADGIVEEVLVLAGDQVSADQVVARLVDDDARLSLRRAEADLLQRHAALRGARADLTAAGLRLEHLVERTRDVALAHAIVAETTAEIERGDADVAVEHARLRELQDEVDRKSTLVASQAVSEATIARLRLRRDAQEAVWQAAIARRRVLAAKLGQAEAELQAAALARDLLIDERRAVGRAEAATAGAEAAVAIAEVARDEAALTLSRMEVRTSVDGVVMRRLVSPGSKLTRDGTEHSLHVVHVYDPARLQVRVDVPLADVVNVTVGQHVEITVEVLPDDRFAGSVTRIVHEADLQKNTVEVKVRLDDPKPALKPEMLARVRFLAIADSTGSLRQRVFAPEALVGGGTALIVTDVAEGRGRAERRTVTTGTRRIDDWIEIASGLSVGDRLIIDAPPDLESGDRIRVVGEQVPNGDGGTS